jgi:uncharacterized protein (DUF1015 family)
MLRIRPFAALRPQPTHAARVTCPPYDVVTVDEARAVAVGNPVSFMPVIRPEIDLPASTDPHDDAVYARARENLDRLRAERVLVRDDAARVYLYRQVMQHRRQIGLVCCCHIDDYATNVIRKHEHTRREKEDDRTRHVLATNANTGPVFLTYRDDATLDLQIARDTNNRPFCHFDAPDGVTHTVWDVADPRPYVDAFAALPCAYVADGHHRTASAVRAGATRRDENPAHTGDEEYNWFLTVLFPASQLHILPYHRVIRDLGGRSPDDVRNALGGVGTLTATTDPDPGRPGAFCLRFADGWWRLEIDPATIDASDPVASLDVALLQDRVLAPVFGIEDVRADPRIDFVGGIRGTETLNALVESSAAAVAIAMNATTIEQLMTVSDADEVMPPKSTWFEPKLRSGLFVHEL